MTLTIHQIAAFGGLAGALIALLWIAFDDAREVSASLNDGADEGADWGAEGLHFESASNSTGVQDHGQY